MKKTFAIISVSLITTLCAAQSVEQGNKDLDNERFAGAAKNFNAVIQQDPGNAAAWFGLVRATVLGEQPAQALQYIHTAPASAQQAPLFKVAYGYALLAQQKNDSALLMLNQALSDTRNKNVGIMLAVAQAHVENKSGNADLAIPLIEKAVKKDKDNPAIHVLAGDAWLKKNDGSKAYQSYNEALRHNEQYAPALHKLGMIFLAQKSRDLYLDYFNKAVAADAAFAPSIYQLYAHYFYYDAAKAMEYFNRYVAVSDATVRRDYDLADLQYLNKEYDKALATAGSIISSEGAAAQPRIYKLMAYSYAGNLDSTMAAQYMNRYLAQEADSNLLAKDFELMAALSKANGTDSSTYYIAKAIALEKDPAVVYGYYSRLANEAKAEKDYATQAFWMEKFYTGNDKATNVDLFNWGLAHYLAQDYQKADSVFGVYVGKYPEQSFGYYWQARANVALDKEMTEGLAVPIYQKLVEVLQKETANANYKKWMAEAFGYLAAYEANTQKDYKEAIDYFEKVLEVDPENESAKKYISILEKDIASQQSDSK